MSTLGKVLSILVILAVIAWMFLASGIAQYNINWGKRLQEVNKEVEELKKPLPGLRTEIARNTYIASTEQVALDRIRRQFRADMTMAQKTESMTKESLARINDQYAAARLEAQNAQKRADKRLAERIELEKQIVAEQTVVADLIADNTAKKATLTGLQQAFLSTVSESKTFVERLLKKSQKTTVAPTETRLGSLSR